MTNTPPRPTTSLYLRLGGAAAVTGVVDQFLKNVIADTRINARFINANVPRLREKLIEQISGAAGGPVEYTGTPMRETHAGMDITDAEFDALVGDLVAALDHFKVPEREKAELLGMLAPMREDIVAVPPTSEQRMARLEREVALMSGKMDIMMHYLESGAAARPAAAGAEATGDAAAPAVSIKTKPWTPEEKALSVRLVKEFTDAPLGERTGAETELIGSSLPQTRFLASDGNVVDLRGFQGKKVALFVMRGFAGYVCLNCSSQLIAIMHTLDEFKKRNVEVFVVYPGEAAAVPSFLRAVSKLEGGQAPPFPILLDVGLAATRTFRIEGQLAKPTTMILDDAGVVRWAYVGTTPGDRPSAKAVLAQIDALGQ